VRCNWTGVLKCIVHLSWHNLMLMEISFQLVGDFKCRAGKNISKCSLVSCKSYAVKM
jgi:hypothetical protein